MEVPIYTLLALAALGLLVFVVWRLSSRRYSLPCPVWLRWLVELDNPFTKHNRAAVIVEHLDLEPGMTVLDVGCGPGRLTLPVAEKVGDQGEVIAMDIQPGMIRRAQQRASDANLANIQFLQAGVGEGRLPKNHFDRALLVTVLGEIPDRESALKEIFDALKPGGILSVTEVIFDPHFQRRHTAVRLCEAAGFFESAFFGRRFAYSLHMQKPSAGKAHT